MRLRRLVRPEVTVPMGSRRIRIDLRDRIIAKRLYLGIAWERDLQQLLAAMSLRGGVCLDIGANIGVHSLIMSELVGPAGRVLPAPSRRRIYELIRDGDQVDVIVCRNAALLEEVLVRWHGGRLGP